MTERSPVTSLMTGFVEELRAAGVPVSMVETIDAMRAVEVMDISDRAALKAGLSAAMVKSARHLDAFDTAFEVYFALAPATVGEGDVDGAPADAGGDASGEGGGGGDGASIDDLRQALFEALRDMDMGSLGSAAGRAIDELSGFEPGRPVGGTYYLYRTLRRLDLDQIEAMLAEVLASDGDLSDLDKRLVSEEVEARLEELRDALKDEIRRRLVADRGREAVARTLRRELSEDVDLMHATRQDLEAIEDAIAPLTRKLAARLARRRRLRRRGRLDFRKTVRRSLATGGVPMDPVFRMPRPHKPEIFLLCDISGSMATFARFTLQFTYAMSGQFSKLRSFAFIDNVDEVTDFFGAGTDFASALARIGTEAQVVIHDGHSDYGTALSGFVERFGDELTPASTVIITGDARNNYRQPLDEMLGEVAEIARAVYWLNPEPRSYWDTGDSVMSRYAQWCDAVHEVRTLRQLEAFVEEISLPTVGSHL